MDLKVAKPTIFRCTGLKDEKKKTSRNNTLSQKNHNIRSLRGHYRRRMYTNNQNKDLQQRQKQVKENIPGKTGKNKCNHQECGLRMEAALISTRPKQRIRKCI
jgi:hypothetical protein